MTRRRRHAPRDRSTGFTLIELLLVIVVLGILATIVIFGTGEFNGEGKSAACTSNAKILNTAEAAYTTLHPGQVAGGDLAALSQFVKPPPTTGDGAVKYDSTTARWVCA